jgi:hypothetical protein
MRLGAQAAREKAEGGGDREIRAMGEDRNKGAAGEKHMPVPPERAKEVVEKAAKEASDVIQATQTDATKKPRQLKSTVKDSVAKLVESGDPSKVVEFIKSNRKDFISGVFQSWFMKEIRKELSGEPSGSQPPTPAAGKLQHTETVKGPGSSEAEKIAPAAAEPPAKKMKTDAKSPAVADDAVVCHEAKQKCEQPAAKKATQDTISEP